MASNVIISDGQTSWRQGVNSIAPTTIASQQNPDGLARNELAWLINGTVRDGGITTRPGYRLLGTLFGPGKRYQGGFMYHPITGDPYLMLAVDGHIYKVNSAAPTPVDISATAFVPKIVVPGVTIKAGGTNLVGKTIDIDPTSDAALIYGLPSGWVYPALNASLFLATVSDYNGPLNVLIPLQFSFQVVSTADTFFNSLTILGVGQMTLKQLAGPSGVPTGGQVFPPKEITGWAYNGFLSPGIGSNVTIQITRPLNPVIPPPANGTILHFLFGHVQLVSSVKRNDGGSPFNPSTLEQFFFEQAEEFLIIQAGDYITPALFWDGSTMRRSLGITNTTVAPGTPGVNEIPPAGPMDYYQGRLWYAQGRQYSAGDVVRGPSGTGQYSQRDSVLNVTENPLAIGGDGFSLPSEAGNIRALTHTANLDTTLGEGRLYIGTRKSIFSLSVPVSRTDWIAASGNNVPIQTIAQINNGPVGDRSVVNVNGDLFYVSIDPGIRSLFIATRFFGQWGNVDLSAREQRIIQFQDRSLLHGISGVVSNNRLLMGSMPRETASGIVCDAFVPCNFIPVSDFKNEGQEPAWEGAWEGLSVLQSFTGDFGGLERTFAVTLSRADGSIQLWEVSEAFTTDILDAPSLVANVLTGQEQENRITMKIEFPAYTWGNVFELKELVSGELWVDRVYGENIVTLEYRQDSQSCWNMWHQFKICQPRNSCELVENPVCYPIEQFGEGFKQTISFPKPQEKCESQTSRPTYIGYQFQARLTVKGFLRVRGFLLHATRRDKELYDDMICPP